MIAYARSMWTVALGLVLGSVALSLATRTTAQESQSEQRNSAKDVFERLSYFTGTWEGAVQGKSGSGRVECHYEYILQGRYLFGKTKAVFAPQGKNPDGETHEDWAIYSYDRGRKKVVMRQFNAEGFVNQFTLSESSADGKTLVFTTEKVENGPPGLRARTTYKIISDDEYTETFELAFPGSDFEPCVETRLKRTK